MFNKLTLALDQIIEGPFSAPVACLFGDAAGLFVSFFAAVRTALAIAVNDLGSLWLSWFAAFGGLALFSGSDESRGAAAFI